MFVLDCANPCRFLGGFENEPQQVDSEKIKINNSVTSEKETKVNGIENASLTFCTLCNVEMSQGKTKFKMDSHDSARFGAKVLPVIVYICPKCGKIDFRADEKLIKK